MKLKIFFLTQEKIRGSNCRILWMWWSIASIMLAGGYCPHHLSYFLCDILLHSAESIAFPNVINWAKSARKGSQHLLSPYSGLATK